MLDLPVPFGPIKTVTSLGKIAKRWKHLKFCIVMLVIIRRSPLPVA